MAGERGCGRTTRDPAIAWFLLADYFSELETEVGWKEITFMRLAENGVMNIITFAFSPEMGYGRLVKFTEDPLGFLPSVPDCIAIALDWMFEAQMVADKHDVGSYTELNARISPHRYDGVVAIGNREDGPEYCCRLGRSISQAQQPVVVTPEVRMVPEQGTEG